LNSLLILKRRAGKATGLRFWVFACLALLLSSDVLAGGEIRGRVTGQPDHAPLQGAHVQCPGQSKGTVAAIDGSYRLEGISTGTVTVRVSHVGFKSQEKTVTLADGQRLRIDFKLEPDAISAPEIEIRDNRPARTSLDQPVRLDIITARSITNHPSQDIVSVLDYISGVNLSSTMGIFANNTVVTLRGMSGNDQARTLVLLDGVPMNKADAGSVNWNLVNRDNVEQIEVIKGPGSARYGSGAMGGVISIRTRQPSKTLSGVATVDYGTFNTAGIKYQAGGMLRNGRKDRGLTYGINGFYRRSDGYNSEIPEYLEKSDTFNVNNYLREAAIGVRTGYRFDSLNRLEATGNFFNDKRGRGIAIYEIDGAFERHGTWQATLQYQGGFRVWRWNILAYNTSEHFERLNEYMKEAEYNLYLVKSARIDRGMNLNFTRPAGKHQTVTAGADYQYGSVDGQDIYYTSTDLISNAGKMDTWALFLQDEIALLHDRLRINLGIRLNTASFHDGSFRIEEPSYSIQYLVNYQDSALSGKQWIKADPKLSLQYRFSSRSRIYLSAARGFRAPNLDDLCRTGKMYKGFKVANPSLGPEILDNIEAGADVTLFGSLRASLSAYYSTGTGFMYYISTGDSVNMGYKRSPVFIKENISRAEIMGLEADLDAEPFRWLSLFANYTYNHSVIARFQPRNPAVDADLTGKFLTDVPMHKASAGATVKTRMLNVHLLWKYTGRRYVNETNEPDPYLLYNRYPSFQTVSARVWRTFFGHLTVALNADNIFNVTFIDDRLQHSPGRMVTAEISATF